MKRYLTACALAFCLAAGFSTADAATISNGDQGHAVKEIQQRLSKHGFHVKADGAFGEETASAVRHFQMRRHLAADGIVGPETYRALTGKKMPVKLDLNRYKAYSMGHISGTDGKASGGARAITEEARKYIGIPYRFGGTDRQGFDCSGFIQYVYRVKGISLPRAADEQYHAGRVISEKSLAPGDLVFFSTYEDGVSHSGIYMGNGSFISATTSRGIAIADMTSGYWRQHYVGARRIL